MYIILKSMLILIEEMRLISLSNSNQEIYLQFREYNLAVNQAYYRSKEQKKKNANIMCHLVVKVWITRVQYIL